MKEWSDLFLVVVRGGRASGTLSAIAGESSSWGPTRLGEEIMGDFGRLGYNEIVAFVARTLRDVMIWSLQEEAGAVIMVREATVWLVEKRRPSEKSQGRHLASDQQVLFGGASPDGAS